MVGTCMGAVCLTTRAVVVSLLAIYMCLAAVAYSAVHWLQDPRINWIVNPVHKHRELRGLTSAGKKYRGLRGKGHNYHKAHPSKRAVYRKHQSPSFRRYR